MVVRGVGAWGRASGPPYTLIQTAKLNDVDPQAWLADVPARIADHPIGPWVVTLNEWRLANYAPPQGPPDAAIVCPDAYRQSWT
jgi:hypothetical protein